MNLLTKKYNNEDYYTVENFRKIQYDYIPCIIETCMKYVSKQGNGFLNNFKIEQSKLINYFGIYNSQYIQYTVNVIDDKNESHKYFNLILPELIDGYLFYLNGNYYVPSIYFMDFPISVKKQSLMIYGLINSITIYFGNNMIIFTNNNIPLNIFLQLFIYDDEEAMNDLLQISNNFKKLEFETLSTSSIVNYFFNTFKTKKDIVKIQNYIEELFLDDITKELFETCYKIPNITLKKILKKSLKMFLSGQHSFIDLKNKRLIFAEPILYPLLSKISYAAISSKRGFRNYDLKINQISCLKNFLKSAKKTETGKSKELSGNYIYDSANLYSGILRMKSNMLPIGINEPPREIKDVHPTHKYILCPITISNKKPGSTVSLIPGNKISKLGLFKI